MRHHRLNVAKGFTLTHSQNPQNIFDAINFARLPVPHNVCDVPPSQILVVVVFFLHMTHSPHWCEMHYCIDYGLGGNTADCLCLCCVFLVNNIWDIRSFCKFTVLWLSSVIMFFFAPQGP